MKGYADCSVFMFIAYGKKIKKKKNSKITANKQRLNEAFFGNQIYVSSNAFVVKCKNILKTLFSWWTMDMGNSKNSHALKLVSFD